jgi:excisionase family DNA binding protein
MDRTPLWTVDELFSKLHVSKATIHTWRKRGTAPRAYRIGRNLLFDEADVQAWLEQHEATKAERDDAAGNGWGSAQFGWSSGMKTPLDLRRRVSGLVGVFSLGAGVVAGQRVGVRSATGGGSGRSSAR